MNKINDPLEDAQLLPAEVIEILKSLDIDLLKIPNRAKNSLQSHDISNIYDAIPVIMNGFPQMTGIGHKTIEESCDAMRALLCEIQSAPAETIPNLLETRQICDFNWQGNLVEVFPLIVEHYFATNTKEHASRNQDIFYKRYNLAHSGHLTLEEIGQHHLLTRERVRQIESKIIQSLKQILIGQSKLKTWVLDCRITTEFKRIQSQLGQRVLFVTRQQIENMIFQDSSKEITEGYFRILMKVLGYLELPQNIDGFRGSLESCWYNPELFDRQVHESVFRELDFIYGHIDKISLQQVFHRLKNKCAFDLDEEFMLSALKICQQIELLDGFIRIKFEALKSVADKAYRILQESQIPLHYSTLCHSINQADDTVSGESKTIHKNSLVNQMTSDERFLPLGKSGKWGLKEWPYFENITIVQAMQMVLEEAQEPISFMEIAEGLKIYRADASEKSILVYLLEKTDIFSKVGADLYGLSHWGFKPLERRKQDRVSNALFYEKALELLRQTNPMALPDFLKKMTRITGLREVSIRKRIQESPILKTQSTLLKYHEIYCENCDVDLEAMGLINYYLRDRIQREILNYFRDNSNHAMRKKELYDAINERIACHTSTFYQYLDKFESIRHIKSGQDTLVCLKVEQLEL